MTWAPKGALFIGDFMKVELSNYDWIVVNSSSGKDSQAMLDLVATLAAAEGVSGRVVVAHADLRRAEWKGAMELAKEHADHYGFRFIRVSRPQGDLLMHVEKRGMWPSSTARYCTSDHKRGQISKVFTQLAQELGRPARILNCLGMRRQESPVRAKLVEFCEDQRNSSKNKQVDKWHPIIDWTLEQVWERIRSAGTRPHPAYALGMPRLSCCFCVFAPRSALMLSGKHNPELLDEYVRVEAKIGHSFRKDFRIAEVKAALAAGEEPQRVQDWRM